MEVNSGTEKHFIGTSTSSVKQRRSMDGIQETDLPSPRYRYLFDENKHKKVKVDHKDPFSVRDWVLDLESANFGSVTKDIEDLYLRRMRILMPCIERFPSLRADSVDLKLGKESSTANDETKSDTNARQTIVFIDSDDDEPTCRRPFQRYQDVVPDNSKEQSLLQISSMEVNSSTEKHLIGTSTPSVKQSRSMDCSQETDLPSPRYRYLLDENKHKKVKVDHNDPFSVRDLVLDLGSANFGSVTKDIEDLCLRRMRILMPCIERFPSLRADSVDLKLGKESSTTNDETKSDTNARQTIVHIDSDDDEPTCQRPFQRYLDVVADNPKEQVLGEDSGKNQTSKGAGDTITAGKPNVNEGSMMTAAEPNVDEGNLMTVAERNIDEGDTITAVEPDIEKDNIIKDDVKSGIEPDKGEYVGVRDDDMDMEESDPNFDVNFDGLTDIWKEMAVGLESSKNINVSNNEHAWEDVEECDHTFILKEDIGYVCRVCGIIQRSIESIIEFQRPKSFKSFRTYYYESHANKSGGGRILDGVKLPGTDFSVCELYAHPRHKKQMKPHQIEGFNFLLSNLVSENPGGCILAHAPGSGKTFMLISFIQSFMAKYQDAKPLVILPRGILGTWKKEFKRWQVEDIVLLDFYSSKADSRAQQLEVLKHWTIRRSILFIGYQQFSSIVCDTDTSSITVSCQDILLTHPSILILDEGHTPRNQDTNMMASLEKVQTPRKVVLSGTLYQNHVKEVFNILNLVRPKFLRMENPKVLKRRILSRVPIESRRNLLKKGTDNEFYDVVEHTLLKDENFRRKVTVIEDLREMTSRVLHYYKGDFLDELPGLVDFSVFLKLSPVQKREVSELRKLARKFKISSDGSAIYVHPGLKCLLKNTAARDRKDDNVSNIDLLLEKLDEREGVKAKFFLNMLRLCESGGEKLLVFGQYLLPLKFLLRLTIKLKGWSLGKEIFMITGDHDNDEREIAMDQFNNSPESRVFFGSIKACGEGISLVGASRIIILDVHLNPSVTRQAIGRAFRPGQVRKVYTYRLIAADSPEEEDHITCFKKESIAKMWFDWNEYCGHHDFEMEMACVKDCGDQFLETSWLNEDITAIYKR